VAAIDDLIAQVEDKVLRERLHLETQRITKEKKFGLVFEDHLPELTPIYSAKIKKGCKVALRSGPLTELWRVLLVKQGEARCLNRSSGEQQTIPLEELVVVRQFGEPIFPALTPVDRVQNGPEDASWHTLIEADNYHALQLLEYLYAGKVDCIYIDPPYNSGARDWKYNNDYVDSNDSWRHSKWLAFMQRRLLLAKKLLHPTDGVLIVTIDEHEMHNLRVLLSQIFPGFFIQTVTAVINPKGVTQGRFSRVEEYVIYCFGCNAFVSDSDDNLLNLPDPTRKPRWKGLLRSGTNARRVDRKNMFYPVLIDEEKKMVVGAGDSLPYDEEPVLGERVKGYAAAWPIRTDGSYGNWGVGFSTLRELIKQGYVSCGKYDEKRQTFGISYVSKPNQQKIESGDIKIVGRDSVTNVVNIEFADTNNRAIKTVWHRTRHDAGAYGTEFVKDVIGPKSTFDFPKSIYSVRDAIASVLKENPFALVIDFFAGSGTALNAVNLLNDMDRGSRRCIMVTNNEVSLEDALFLREGESSPGQEQWEARGICRSITWPRSKYTIIGKRDDGSPLKGEYLTGKTTEAGKPRKFQKIAFTSVDDMNTADKKKQLVALIDGIPQSKVKKDSAFVVSEKHSATILFDESEADVWLEALVDHEHITDFYIVTAKKASFDELKVRINDLLGPIIVTEEEKRPMSDGFPANLEYFRLDFLDKDHVALGRQFREILPILWLRAGAIGARPELPKNRPIPEMVIPEQNPFAVLVEESHFSDFLAAIEAREDITHIYLVTDSEDAFQEMSSQLRVLHVVQLYRDYLENFVINQSS